jgi:protein-S-isoprenylcysteine O-methyltransferase Ste14
MKPEWLAKVSSMADAENFKQGLILLMIANALLTLPMAVLVKRDFLRLGHVSLPMAVWTGAAMHGHAIATFVMAWSDSGSAYSPTLWSLVPGGLIFTFGAYIIYLGRKAYGDRKRVYGLKENELIEHGIYRRSRNPQYLGYWLMFVGTASASGSLLAFGFALVFALLVHGYITIVEEPHLKRHFGADYTLYCQRVARYFRIDASEDLKRELADG